MTHETGQQRYRRLKRDPLRHQKLATLHTPPPVRCADCNHSEIMHGGRCLSYVVSTGERCPCTEYREVETDASA